MYALRYRPRALKQLAKLPDAAKRRVVAAIGSLARNPRPRGCLKLEDSGRDLYRIRIGDYRVMYEVQDRALIVIVVRVGKRAEDTYEGI